MRWNGEVYAAKIFYNIGSDSTGVPSLEDNLKHLKEELICAKIAENSLSAFNRDAREKRISVFGISFSTYRQNYLNAKESDLCIAQSFIITVAEGPDQGLSWLVDLFLDNGGMRKFSGTLQAGFNNDLVKGVAGRGSRTKGWGEGVRPKAEKKK